MKLHLPKEVWLFGKGPGLDTVKWEEVGYLFTAAILR